MKRRSRRQLPVIKELEGGQSSADRFFFYKRRGLVLGDTETK